MRRYAGKEIAGVAASIQLGLFLQDREYKKANSIAKQIIETFPDTELEKHSLYTLGILYWYHLGDAKTGETYFRQLIEKHPRDDLAISARSTLGEWSPKPQESKSLTNSFDGLESVPGNVALYQNYPNPFNPVTKIGYALPDPSTVKLTIYNLRGRQIKELVNHTQSEGNHHVLWDGTNDEGQQVANGVYFYKIVTNDYHKVLKMLLVR